MSDKVKLIIEIPKEDYEFTKGAKTARVFPSEYYVKLILNGIPLDDVKAEIVALPKTYPFVNHIDTYVKEDDVLQILANIGKESEVKPNE